MITEIIDLIVDANNSLGSLISSFITRFRNYRSCISSGTELQETNINLILSDVPEIDKELTLSNLHDGYVLLTKIESHKGNSTIEVVFLDNNLKYRHSFSVLKKNNSFVNNISAPCYWRIKESKDI